MLNTLLFKMNKKKEDKDQDNIINIAETPHEKFIRFKRMNNLTLTKIEKESGVNIGSIDRFLSGNDIGYKNFLELYKYCPDILDSLENNKKHLKTTPILIRGKIIDGGVVRNTSLNDPTEILFPTSITEKYSPVMALIWSRVPKSIYIVSGANPIKKITEDNIDDEVYIETDEGNYYGRIAQRGNEYFLKTINFYDEKNITNLNKNNNIKAIFRFLMRSTINWVDCLNPEHLNKNKT